MICKGKDRWKNGAVSDAIFFLTVCCLVYLIFALLRSS
jgi:hypothetical protein